MPAKTVVVLSDLHYPYHDEDVHKIVESFLEDFKPHTLVLNGDVWDMPTISKYHPRRQEVIREIPLQTHIDTGREGIALLIDAAKPKRVLFALGNHEDRWNQYLGTQAKALASLKCLDFDQLFGLRGIEWKEYGDGFWLNDNLFVYHGNFHGISALRKERERAGVSTVTGHGHTQGIQYHTDRKRTYKSIAQGCLCKLDPPYSRIVTNWQHGLVKGVIIDEDKFDLDEVELVHGHDELWMAVDGVMYKKRYGENRVARKRLY